MNLRKRWTLNHGDPPVSARLSKDAAKVALIGTNGEMMVRSSKTGDSIWMNRLKGDPSPPCFNADSHRILVAGLGIEKNEIGEFDAETGRPLWTLNADYESFTSAEYVSGSPGFVSVGVNHHKRLPTHSPFEAESQKWVGGERVLELRESGLSNPIRSKRSGLADIKSVVASDRINELVLGGDRLDGGGIEIYRLPSLELSGSLVVEAGAVWKMAISSDGAYLCAVDQEFSCVRLADLSERRWLHTTPIRERVFDVCFLGDSDFMAAGCADGQVRIWSARTPERLFSVQAYDHDVALVCSSPAACILLTADETGEIALWEEGR